MKYPQLRKHLGNRIIPTTYIAHENYTYELCRLQCTTSRNSFIDLFEKAISEKDVKLEALKESIVEFEAKGLGNANVSDLSGCWELVWSSLIPGGYFPVQEVVNFLDYSLESKFGPIPLGTFKGSSIVVSSSPAVIEFTPSLLNFGPLSFPVNGKSRSYSFLHIDSNVAVAKSSSGGFSLLRRVE